MASPLFYYWLSDGESSFMIITNKNNKCETGYQTQGCFQIGLHQKDRALLEMIQSYFNGAGSIKTKEKI